MEQKLTAQTPEIAELSSALSEIYKISKENKMKYLKDHKKYEMAKKYDPKASFVQEMSTSSQAFGTLDFCRKASIAVKDEVLLGNHAQECDAALKFSIIYNLSIKTVEFIDNASSISKTHDKKINDAVHDYHLNNIYSGRNYKNFESFREEAPTLYKKRDRSRWLANMPDAFRNTFLGIFGGFGLIALVVSLFLGIFEGSGFGEFLMTPPIGTFVGALIFCVPCVIVGLIITSLIKIFFEKRMRKQNKEISKIVSKPMADEKKRHAIEFQNWQREQGIDLSRSCTEALDLQKDNIIELLSRAKALSARILKNYLTLIPAKYKYDTEALEAMSSFLDENEADTISEAIDLYLEKKKDEKFRAELAEILGNLAKCFEAQHEATQEYIKATERLNESHAYQSEKPKTYKTDTDWAGREIIVDEDGNQVARVTYEYSSGNVEGSDGKIYHKKSS